jgi:hypothetical protein
VLSSLADDWIDGKEDFHIPDANVTSPLIATRTAWSRARHALEDRVNHSEGYVLISGEVKVWAREYATDDPRSIMYERYVNSLKEQLAVEERELADLQAQGCCFCIGKASKDALATVQNRIAELKRQIDDKSTDPWGTVLLKNSEEIAQKWAETQKSLVSDFVHQLERIQQRTAGTLGFTLRDEWRYLNFEKGSAVTNEEIELFNLNPQPPQAPNRDFHIFLYTPSPPMGARLHLSTPPTTTHMTLTIWHSAQAPLTMAHRLLVFATSSQ